MTEGYFNIAYEIHLSNEEQVILKIAPLKEVRVMTYEKISIDQMWLCLDRDKTVFENSFAAFHSRCGVYRLVHNGNSLEQLVRREYLH